MHKHIWIFKICSSSKMIYLYHIFTFQLLKFVVFNLQMCHNTLAYFGDWIALGNITCQTFLWQRWWADWWWCNWWWWLHWWCCRHSGGGWPSTAAVAIGYFHMVLSQQLKMNNWGSCPQKIKLFKIQYLLINFIHIKRKLLKHSLKICLLSALICVSSQKNF